MKSPHSDRPQGVQEQRWHTLALGAVLILTGALAWSLTLKPALEVDVAPLAALPYEISGWRGVDVPLEDEVTRMLDADFNLQRAYRHPLGGLVWLYVGYYGTDRGGSTGHTPWICYPTSGWEILRSERIVVDERLGLAVNEIVVERERETRLVHFWFRSHRRTGITGTAEQLLDRMLGRLLDGRADGALVRVSTPISNGQSVPDARSTLRSFAGFVDGALGAHWPHERAEGS
ncbi:MAG: EpsI family protein [Myxococcales bacterium]|nr:EpsI family protein [Myxococcales bacterium]